MNDSIPDRIVDALIERMHGGRANVVTGAEGCAWTFLLALAMVLGTILLIVALAMHII